MWLRITPSNWAGRAAIALRERSLRASVLSSTRTQPSSSKACPIISSFASTLAPVRQAAGFSQVQPISTTRSAGRTLRKRLLPTAEPLARERVRKGPSVPASAAARVSSAHSSKRAGSLRFASQSQISGAAAGSRSSSMFSAVSGSSATIDPSRRLVRGSISTYSYRIGFLKRSIGCLALAAAVLALLAPGAGAVPAVGIVKGTKLLAGFDTASPGSFTSIRSITGTKPSERLEDLDYRWHPRSDLNPVPPPQLFALAIEPGLVYTARIYTIDLATGAASLVGPGFMIMAANSYGMDFNPASDRIRVVNDLDGNLRINPDDGSLAGLDSNLDEPGEKVTALAYDRVGTTLPPADPTNTTAFGIGSFADALYTIGGIDQTPNSNGGELLNGKLLGLVLANTSRAGFDIDPVGTAFATLNPDGAQGLYTVDLATGAATLVGKLPEELTGLAIVPPPPVAPPTPPSVTPDRIAPRVSLAGVKSSVSLAAFLKGIQIQVAASEPAGLAAELRAAARSAKLSAAFNLVLAEASASIAPGQRTLKLKPSRKLVGKPARKFKVSLRVTATDAAGNAATATKTITVKPPKKKKPKK